MAKPLYRVIQVAEILTISVPSVYRLLASGKLRKIKIGGATRVTAEELDRYLASLQEDENAY